MPMDFLLLFVFFVMIFFSLDFIYSYFDLKPVWLSVRFSVCAVPVFLLDQQPQVSFFFCFLCFIYLYDKIVRRAKENNKFRL